MDLYSTYAQEFSSTRQAPWQGWKRLLKYLKAVDRPSILDLGCGNGRFLKYLVNSGVEVSSYLGVDNSSELLHMTDEFMDRVRNTNKLAKFELLNLDFEDISWATSITEKFNFIGAFGITHHLKTPLSRTKFFESTNFLLKPKGILAVTFWDFLGIDRYQNKISPIKVEGSKNDYLMSFGNQGATRFCHYYNPLEIIEYTNQLPFNLIEEFFEDGAENNQNKYLIFKKQ